MTCLPSFVAWRKNFRRWGFLAPCIFLIRPRLVSFWTWSCSAAGVIPNSRAISLEYGSPRSMIIARSLRVVKDLESRNSAALSVAVMSDVSVMCRFMFRLFRFEGLQVGFSYLQARHCGLSDLIVRVFHTKESESVYFSHDNKSGGLIFGVWWGFHV